MRDGCTQSKSRNLAKLRKRKPGATGEEPTFAAGEKKGKEACEASKLRMSARILPEGEGGYDRMEMGVIRMKSLNKIHELLHECQGWMGETQLNRQILLSEGPWTGEDLWIALELYFQTEGLSTHGRCQHEGCGKCKPPIVTRMPEAGSESTRRVLCGFCTECWNFTDTRNGREVVGDMDFLTKSGVFKTALKQDGQFVIVGENGNECRR